MIAVDNPLVASRWRGDTLESVHRGAWVIVRDTGEIVAHAGDPNQMVFARSSSKSMQAVAVVNTGILDRFNLDGSHLAAMVSSHNAEPIHIAAARAILAAAGLDESLLQCGAAPPYGDAGANALSINHNCSGKHAGFLAACVASGADPYTYLDLDHPIQRAIREAVTEISGVDPAALGVAIDGCSAPTFVMPLKNLAQGIARVANPGVLDAGSSTACARIVDAVAAHPMMIAGRGRFDTDVVRASDGRLFSKVGADGVQVIGVVGENIAVAAKIDDGSLRALWPLAIAALVSVGAIRDSELNALSEWTDPVIRNAAGLAVGRHDVLSIGAP